MCSANVVLSLLLFFFSSRRRHTRLQGDWSSDVCSSDRSAGNLPREKSAAGSRTQSRARSGRDDRAGWQRLSWWMKLSMPKKIIVLAVVLARMMSAMLAAENHIDVAAIINKADAESVLGVKVKEPMPGNFQGGDGYYSKCNYYSVTPGKTLLLRTYQAAAG